MRQACTVRNRSHVTACEILQALIAYSCFASESENETLNVEQWMLLNCLGWKENRKDAFRQFDWLGEENDANIVRADIVCLQIVGMSECSVRV